MLNKKELDQAFAETPDIVRHGMYQAFRKGEKQLRARRRIIQTLSFAAAFVMMVCVGLLMRHVHLIPAPDVLRPGQGDLQPDASAAALLPTGTPEVTEQPTAVPTFHETPEATAFVTPEVTVQPTDTPTPPPPAAPEIADSDPADEFGQPMIYATENGNFYHILENCQGMKGALAVSLRDVVSQGKTACPNCLGGSLENVYLTDDSAYYHTSTACPDAKALKKSRGFTEDMALLTGALPCPGCTEANYDRLDVGKINLQLAAGEVIVYTYSPGADYHKTPDFCGSADNKYDRSALLLGTALREGSLPCAQCYPGWQLESVLYFTPGGMYYHTLPDCSGMKNASAHSLESAVNSGKQPCALCCPFAAGDESGARNHINRLFETAMGTEIPFPQGKNDTMDAERNNYFAYSYQEGSNEIESDQLDIIQDGQTLSILLMFGQQEGLDEFLLACGNENLRQAYQKVSALLIQMGETGAYIKGLQVSCRTDASPYLPRDVGYELAFITEQTREEIGTLLVRYDAAAKKVTSMEWSSVDLR